MAAFIVFGILSFLTIVLTILWMRLTYLHKLPNTQFLSILNQFTVGVFLASFFMFIPVYYHWDAWGDGYTFLRPLLQAFTSTMRLFVLGVDLDVVEKAVPATPEVVRVLFCLQAAGLYLVAPILTFTNVLAIFSDLLGELQLLLGNARPVYIFSELNVQAITLAESVREKCLEEDETPLLVFAEVNPRDDDSDYELRLRAKQSNAIFLQKAVNQIRLAKWGKAVEIFLISENETKNVEHAKALTELYRDTPRETALYVYAAADFTDTILDTMDKGKSLLSREFRAHLEEDPESVLYNPTGEPNPIPMTGTFSLRRIDPADTLVKHVLTHNNYADYAAIHEAAQQDKTISVTILGAGRYGMHFLKTAVWFYQRFGYRVECNLIDMGGENGDPEKHLEQQCPDLMKTCLATEDDEAQYDIRFFTGIDCLGADLNTLISKTEKDRFAKTKLVFIALGNDDTNTQAALNLRIQFNRLLLEQKKALGQLPFIYSVIYDDQMASNLNDYLSAGLKNERSESYNICFVGSRTIRYDYKVIRWLQKSEQEAFDRHLDWLRNESRLRKHYEIAVKGDYPREQAPIYREFLEKLPDPITWNDADYFPKLDGKPDYSGKIRVDKVVEEAESYMRYAYYRNSSLAKAEHARANACLQKLLKKETRKPQEHLYICNCRDCVERRITEHMRWNAYMRSTGHSLASKRHRLAKYHPDLVPWKKLDYKEQFKD